MGSNLDEFKSFVKAHPGLNDIVQSKKKSWQDIYEEWTFYKDDSKWDIYKDPTQTKIIPSKTINQEEEQASVTNPSSMEDMMKSALNYVKKINPDSISKTVTNAQKILALVSGLGIGGAAAKKSTSTGDPLFDKRFDEWY